MIKLLQSQKRSVWSVKFMKRKWVKVKIGQDQIEVIVNKENPVQKISVDQLKKIYTGELTKWAQLNGAKEEK